MKLVSMPSGDPSPHPDAPRNLSHRAPSLRSAPGFLPSDRNITRWLLLLLLVSRDMTSVERTFSCQTVMRL